MVHYTRSLMQYNKNNHFSLVLLKVCYPLKIRHFTLGPRLTQN